MNRRMWQVFPCVALIVAIAASVWLSGAERQEGVIVKCARPCAGVVTLVATLGGAVSHRYDNVDAVAVTVPATRIADLSAAVGADAVRKDFIVKRPPPGPTVEVQRVQSVDAVAQDALAAFLKAQPANYNYNNALTGAASLHQSGLFGQNVIVGVIDSGAALATPALAGSVIGGETFVPASEDPVASATSRLNDFHGTAVGNMIAGHANFAFATTSVLPQALHAYSSDSVIDCPDAAFPGCPAGTSVVPLIGTAPAARIYALKVFPSQGGGAPESRIIAAMDRVITLRRRFNEGEPSAPVSGTGTEDSPFEYESLNIRVVNMSLGGPTLNAGRDLEDQLTLAMLDVGITPVIASGNDGFAALTVNSPGSGIGAVTVGAANTPVHERVLRDVQFGPGVGVLYRPFNRVQTAYFSSRGPTADGRFDPDMSANGFGSYVNAFAAVSPTDGIVSCGSPLAPPSGPGACTSRILFVSGTSFSTPTTSGAAALLRAAVPAATAIQTRNAIVAGANPSIVADGSGRIDQGNGFLDVPAALDLLTSGGVADRLPKNENKDDRDDGPDDVGAGGASLIGNLRRLGIRPVPFRHDRYSARTPVLLPGQVHQFYIPSDLFTDAITVTISDIERSGTANTLFGDDLLVMAADAPTSFLVPRDPDEGGTFIGEDTTFTIENPQTGLVRLAVQGDWTNGGTISAHVTIQRTRRLPTLPSAAGRVRQDDQIPFTINVPAGASKAVFELFWLQNWGRYPTNDLDMILMDPQGHTFLDAEGLPPGATANSPERVVIANPAAGAWTVIVDGFLIHSRGKSAASARDHFTLTATADGTRLRIAPK